MNSFESFNHTELLGLSAAILTTISFLPQLIKIWQSQSADDISIGMFLLFALGVLLWAVYGWEIHAFPVILANIITFILAASILTLKIVFDQRKSKV